MIVFSGWGLSSAVIGAAGLFGGVLAEPVLTAAGLPKMTALAAAWGAAAAVNWTIGSRLNNRPERELIDARTGERFVMRSRHTLFWIPMQYYSFPMLLLGAGSLAGLLFELWKTQPN